MPTNFRQSVPYILKNIFRPITVFLIVAFIIFNVIIALSNINYAQIIARNIINAAIPGSISWDGLSISPYAGRVRIANAMMKDADGKIIISFKNLDARISVPGLLQGELIIREAVLDEPAVFFSMDGAGSFNLLEALGITPGREKDPGKKAALPEFLTVERLVLTGGKARWSQPAHGIHAGIDDINISAGLSFSDRSGDLKLMTGTGFFTRGGSTTPFAGLSAHGLMKKGVIKPCEVDARTEGSRLTIGGELKDVFTTPRFDVTSGFSVSLPELGALIDLPGRMSGAVQGSLTVRGPLNNPSADLKCAYGGGEILGSRIDGVSLAARLDDRIATVPSLVARASGGSCILSGTLDLAGAFPEGFLSGNRNPDLASYQADVVMVSFPLRAIPLRGAAPAGAVFAKATARGRGLGPASAAAELSVSATVYNFTFNERGRPAPFSIAAHGMLGRGLLRIESLTASLGNLKASGAGSLDRATGAASASITASSDDLSPEAASFGLDAGGSFAIDAALSGSIRRPAVSLRFSGERLRYGNLSFGNASMEAAIDGGDAISVSRFSLANGSSTVSLSGSAPLRRGGNGPISLDIRTFDVQLAEFNDTVAGHVILGGGISGSVMHPAGSVSLSATAVDLGFQKLDAASIQAGMRGGRIYLDHVTIDAAPGETVRIGGWITPAGAYRLTMSAEGLSLGSNAIVKSTGMDGKLDMSLDGDGWISDPRAKGELALRNVRFNDRQFDDFRITLSLADGVIRANGKLNFNLAGYYDLFRKNFDISLVFDKTDISPFLSAAVNPGLNATLSGTLSARGNIHRLQGIDLTANLSDCGVYSGARMLLSTGSLKASLRGGMLSVPQARITILDSGWIRISGSGPIRSAVAIDSDGLIPVELANWFSNSLANAIGIIRFTTNLRGDLFRPSLSAGITLVDIGFDIPSISSGLRGVSGSIDVRPGLITIPAIRGSLGDGTIGMNGTIGLRGFSPRDIMVNLRADRAVVSVPDTLDLDFNALLNIAGTPDRIMVRGDVTILRGLYYQDLVLNPFQNIGARRSERIVPDRGKSPLEKIKFDIALMNRNPFEIDNNIARMTINNNLRFFGSAARPVLNGSMRVESGSIFYLGREFVINSGKVDFLNPYRIDPMIDIKGSAGIQGWNVLIGLSGKPDALAFTLSSQPVLDSGDILSLILLGKTRGKKSSLPAGQLISEAIALTYGDAIKKKTGIDTIEIRTEDEGKKSSSGKFSATIGKNLNDRVTYYYTVGKDNRGLKSSTTIEYKFFDNFLIDTEYDSNGKTGASIRYSRSFR